MYSAVIFATFCQMIFGNFVLSDVYDNTVDQCDLPATLIQEIASYQAVADTIINSIVKGKFKGFVHNELEYFVDTFGSRVSGTQNLENAIDYMLERLKNASLDNVHGEEVTVPHWVRGKEEVALLQPRYYKIAILGLHNTVPTSQEGLTAEALVVRSFDELESVGDKAKGKIVVFNQDYEGYGKSVQYRSQGASKAAKHGAVAALIRSVTPFSLYTPHTGYQGYDSNVTKIPVGCITVEDAHLLYRLQSRGQKLVLNINITSKTLPDTKSRNSVAEIQGHERPEKVVIVSGHLDSWDVGQGAMDDGGGAFISWGALAVLKALGLRPRRTLRAVLWTAEEEGLVGAYQYEKMHRNESSNINFIMESDEGTFTPKGLEYAGGKTGACVVKEVLKLLKAINTTGFTQSDRVGSDISIWTANGFPGASLMNENERYFWYHHTNADTIDVEDPEALDLATALWATASYVIADLSIDFPRN